MKRLTALLVTGTLALGISYLVSCSDQLDVSNSYVPTPGAGRVDTVFIIDTNKTVDTVIIIDTLITIDTNNVVDTVIIVDTVFIGGDDDSDDHKEMCDEISSDEKEIVWMFRNAEGLYHLEFSAETEHDKPAQTLVVTIDGQTFTWEASENPELITDLHLSQNASIRIILENPGAYGHEVDVCMEMTERK